MRLYTSASDPIDFCKVHFPKTEEAAFKLYGHDGDGPDGRGNCFGYDTEHPDYCYEGYTCHACKKPLCDGACTANRRGEHCGGKQA